MTDKAKGMTQIDGRSWMVTGAEQHLNQLIPKNKLAYSVNEAGAALGVSTWFIRAEIKRGYLHTTGLRGRVLIPIWELVRYLLAGVHTETPTP